MTFKLDHCPNLTRCMRSRNDFNSDRTEMCPCQLIQKLIESGNGWKIGNQGNGSGWLRERPQSHFGNNASVP
jgi:hypothetical protein